MNFGIIANLPSNLWSLLSDEVAASWKVDKAVTEIVKANNEWYILTKQGQGPTGQGFYANSDFPMEKIGEKFKNGQYITSLAWDAEVHRVQTLHLSSLIF